ncbi:MAG TPA: hypothetical protein VIL95_08020, partial [Bacillota bacterium]
MVDVVRMYGPLVLVLAFFYVLFRYLSPLVLPFLAAAAIAVLIEPWVNFGERRLRIPRGLAVGLVLT